jgi:hypothetical protein
VLSETAAIEASVVKAGARANNLRSSILAAAFPGNLVPQDLADEPASAPPWGVSLHDGTCLAVADLSQRNSRLRRSRHERQRNHRPETVELLQRSP